MNIDFIRALTKICGADAIKHDEPMKLHTTFKVGGPADFYVVPKDADTLREAIECCRSYVVPFLIIGNGSNLLVGDQGIRGVVFQIFQTMEDVSFENCEDGSVRVKAGAGILLSRLSREIAKESLGGFEFASGIPGTLGGAVTMNAGAYGGEMCQLIDNVTVLTPEGEIHTLSNEQMQFGYRTSIIQKEDLIVLEAEMLMHKADAEKIRQKISELSVSRREKQPLEYPSAGSTFKRPEGYFAGKLIQDCGLKGFYVGGACVSEKHSGFVINTGDASASDILNLIHHVQKTVYDRFGVTLETEVRLVGEF